MQAGLQSKLVVDERCELDRCFSAVQLVFLDAPLFVAREGVPGEIRVLCLENRADFGDVFGRCLEGVDVSPAMSPEKRSTGTKIQGEKKTLE